MELYRDCIPSPFWEEMPNYAAEWLRMRLTDWNYRDGCQIANLSPVSSKLMMGVMGLGDAALGYQKADAAGCLMGDDVYWSSSTLTRLLLGRHHKHRGTRNLNFKLLQRSSQRFWSVMRSAENILGGHFLFWEPWETVNFEPPWLHHHITLQIGPDLNLNKPQFQCTKEKAHEKKHEQKGRYR